MAKQNLIADNRLVSGEFQNDQVFTIASGHFIHDVYSAFLAPLLPLIIEKLSLTLTAAGSLSAFMQIPAILTPFIGHLSDKHNLRYLVIFAPGLAATMMSSIGFAPNYWILVFFLVLAGFASAFFHAPAPAMVAQISGKRVGKGMSWFMAGGELARTLGPIVAVWAVSTWRLEGMFRIVVVGWASTAILFWRLRAIPIKGRTNGSLQIILPKLRTFFLPLFIITFFRMFMVVCMTSYLPTFMKQNGASLFLAGGSLSILELAGIAGALFGGTLSDKLGRKPLLLGITVLSPLLMIAFLKISGWLLVPILLLYGFVSISAGPVLLALIQDNFPENRAVSNGLYISMVFLVNSIVVILVGMAGDAVGLYTAFWLSSIISLFGLIGIFTLPAEIL